MNPESFNRKAYDDLMNKGEKAKSFSRESYDDLMNRGKKATEEVPIVKNESINKTIDFLLNSEEYKNERLSQAFEGFIGRSNDAGSFLCRVGRMTLAVSASVVFPEIAAPALIYGLGGRQLTQAISGAVVDKIKKLRQKSAEKSEKDSI
ncbi:MAG: hypothetical protein WCX79_03355 [Candidatus Paceibacterota bacterium]